MDELNCQIHGAAFFDLHLFANPRQKWFSDVATESDPWPDAWCQQCNELFDQQGEWNDGNSGGLKARLSCHRCYETHRLRELD